MRRDSHAANLQRYREKHGKFAAVETEKKASQPQETRSRSQQQQCSRLDNFFATLSLDFSMCSAAFVSEGRESGLCLPLFFFFLGQVLL